MAKKEAIPKTKQFKMLVEQLPEFTHNFFYQGTSNLAILSKISYARDLIYFFEYAIGNYPYFPEKGLKEITLDDIKQIKPDDINQFLTFMTTDQGLSVRTVSRRKSSVSVFYNHLINAEQKLDFNPVIGSTKIEVIPNEYVIYLKLNEQEQLLNCIQYGEGLTERQLKYHEKYKKRDLAIIFLFLDTGLRISELQALNVNDVVIYEDSFDPNKNECYVIALRKGKKKSKTTSKVYFSDESKEYIAVLNSL